MDGTIVITTDGSTYSATTQKNGPREEVRSVSSGSSSHTASSTIEESESKENLMSTTVSTVYVSDLNLQDEWVKVTNKGSSPVSLTGWKIEDDSSKHAYVFPSYTLDFLSYLPAT